MDEKQKKFIKDNEAMLKGIFSEKISKLLLDMLDGKGDKNVTVDVINVIRSWLREIEILKSDGDIGTNNFI